MSVILLLAILVMIAASRHRGTSESDNAPFINGDGYHVYYDRKLIERKEVQKRHPEIKGVRTFRRIFGNKPEDKL